MASKSGFGGKKMGKLFGSRQTVQASDPISQSAFNYYKGALGGIRPMLDESIMNSLRNPTYGGQTYAGLDPLQQQYYNNAGMLGGLGQTNAVDTMSGGMNNFNATLGYGQGLSDLATSLQNPAGGYNAGMQLANSPLAQSMVDASTRDIQRNLFNSQLPQLNRTALAGSNTNSTRTGVAEGMMRGLAAENIGDMSAQIRSNLFNQGMNQFNTNIGQQQTALNSLMNANQGSLAGINSAFGLGSNALDAMSGAGNFMRAYNQGAMDDAAKQFYLQQDRPMQLAGSYMNLFNPLSGFSGGAGYGGAYDKPGYLGQAGQLMEIFGAGKALFCWVAREVYGEHNFKWRMFRHWMYYDAPRWLHNLYAAHGEKFALWVHNKPTVKRALRYLMDKAIRPYGGPHGAI
jgi:hypothetical protein